MSSNLVTTASNAFKLSDSHALIIPKEHDPFKLTLEIFEEIFDVALKWVARSGDLFNVKEIYPFMAWDVMPHSGASQIHTHLHAFVG